MQKSFTTDFRLGSKYNSWQYCQKISHLKIFPQLSKTCVFVLIEHILFCQTNQKNMLQKRMKDWTFEVYLLTEELSSWFLLIETTKMTCARPYAWLLNLFSSGRDLNCFLQPSVLPKLNKTTVTCPRSLKWMRFQQKLPPVEFTTYRNFHLQKWCKSEILLVSIKKLSQWVSTKFKAK